MSNPLETRQDLRPVSSDPWVSTWFETLENRRLLSATGQIVAQPALTLSPLASSAVQGYSPQQIKKAYGLDQLTLDGGIKSDGSGQTIAIVAAYDNPNIASDLATFSDQFSLDPANFKKVSQTGSTTDLPEADGAWAQEIALDVEWAHAIAPKANILLVEAESAGLTDLLTAVDYARHAEGVSVVSMSWGTDEFFSEGRYDKYFTTPVGHQGVTFVAASGDSGSWLGASWPAVSSNVLAVGGTTLSISDSSGTYGFESGWSGGGGVSKYIPEPSYQSQFGFLSGKGAPDVSYNANPLTGFAVYDSLSGGWFSIGGTSAGAPQWSALVAIANQGRAVVGAGTLDGATGTLPAIYSLYNSATYSDAFNDITIGRSSWFVGAGSGWDGVSGLGTPKGDPVLDVLVGFGLSMGPSAQGSAGRTTGQVRNAPGKPEAPAPATTPNVQPAPAPAPQVAGSLFSNVRLTPTTDVATIDRESPLTTTEIITGRADGGTGTDGTGSELLAGSNGIVGREVHSTVAQRPDAASVTLLRRTVVSADSYTLRHLSHRPRSDQSLIFSKPGRMFIPSTYDAAAAAASEDRSDDPITLNQLIALIGTGVLIGSYAIEVQRRRRAAMSFYPGIDTER